MLLVFVLLQKGIRLGAVGLIPFSLLRVILGVVGDLGVNLVQVLLTGLHLTVFAVNHGGDGFIYHSENGSATASIAIT